MSKYTEHLRVTAKALLEIADEQDKREASPQPVATLCEAVDKAIRFIESHVDENYSREILAAMRHALTAERKRAVLVENLIDAARRFYQENDGRYDLLRARLSELDAHDKGAENG